MKKKSKITSLIAVAVLVGAIGILASGALAYGEGFDPKEKGFVGRNEHHQVIREAMDEGNYAKWQELTKDHPMAQKIDTIEKFNKLKEGHEAMKSGDTEKAKQIGEELGLPEKGARADHKRGLKEGQAEVKAAVEAGDYQKFQEATQDKKIAEFIDTEEKFNRMVEAHEAMKSGDHDKAKGIKEELGFPGKKGMRGHR